MTSIQQQPARANHRFTRVPHWLVSLVVLAVIGWQPLRAQEPSESPPMRWWKGNLHTHSLWSDGDDFPEMIGAWYREHGYHFLALSDHNVLSEGQRWMKVADVHKRADAEILNRYAARFGQAWVETRGEAGTDSYEVRLKPLDEFAPLLEQAEQFIMIPGEEISDKAEGLPVHMNATNVRDLIQPVGGATVRESMENNLRAVLEHEQLTGRQILPHLNHPNFYYAITAEDLAAVVKEKFFEVYNGHPIVNHLGDDKHMSVEQMWDVANAIRLTQLDAEPLLGIATDDSHEYHGRSGARPGRGWVMVQAQYLTPEHLIRAMKAGRFYASSGVTLTDIDFDTSSQTLSIAIEQAPGATYETEFIAIQKPSEDGSLPEPDAIGVVMQVAKGTQVSYQMTGSELLLRARVTSSLDHPDGSYENQKQQAWTQPVLPNSP